MPYCGGKATHLSSLSAANRARLITNSRKTLVPALDALFLIEVEGKLSSLDAAKTMALLILLLTGQIIPLSYSSTNSSGV